MTTQARFRVWMGLLLLGVLTTACGGSASDRPAPPPDTVKLPPPPPPPPPALPDLVIEDVSWTPSAPIVTPGTTLHITIRVANRGDGAYPQTIVVTGPGNYSGAIVGGLGPGQSGTASIDFPLVSKLVTVTLRFKVDPDNIIRESNENNNESHEITVSTSG